MRLLESPSMVHRFDGMTSAGVLVAGGGPAALQWAVKSAGEGAVCGIAIPFGSGDYIGRIFTPETDFGELLGVPLLWEHGRDPAIKSDPIGEVTDWTKLEEGVWVETQLRKRSQWLDAVKRLLREGKLSFSSGTTALAAALAGDDRKRSWPVQEVSLTQSPANPRATVYRP